MEPSNHSGTAALLENTTQYDDDEVNDIIWKEKERGAIDFANQKDRLHSSSTTQLLGDGLEGSKYHSVSVGKRITVGTE